jgi:hypothetical protein
MRYRIANYLVEMLGGPTVANEEPESYRAQILLFDWGDNKKRGVIKFHEVSPLPDDHRTDDGTIIMHMPINMLANAVDILRNENPVYVEWKKTHVRPRLTTYLEPVGEGEQNSG